MNVTLFHCGPAANESELIAFEHVKSRLQSLPRNDSWVLLANLGFSITHQLQCDEIDLVVIGPPGVRVVEVKHWTQQWVEGNTYLVEQECDRVTTKAKKIGTTLRRVLPNLPRVDGAILLTQESAKTKRIDGSVCRGVRFYSLGAWQGAIGLADATTLSASDIGRLGRVLEPKSAIAIDGTIRRLAGYVNLEVQTPSSERFHRVFKGAHPARRDRVVLHLYDLSASDDKNADTKARREFEALHRLQIHSWAPRILDSYQDVPGYAGEMFFFTVLDPAAPSLAERATDTTWDVSGRLTFTRNTIRALGELHLAAPNAEAIVHRNLTLHTILVRHDDMPILTGFERARIPSEISVVSAGPPTAVEPMWAPEVRELGLAAAGQRSDVYSVCACLKHVIDSQSGHLAQRVSAALSRGLAREPSARAELKELDASLSELLGESSPAAPAPPARFWTEDQVIRFRERDYRILTRLGAGGVGTAFKVIEVDRATREDMGTYVAKVAHDGESGNRVLRAYSLVRSHLRHTSLSTIFEVAREWHENQFIALMTWVSGAPLSDFTGVFPLLAEEQEEISTEALAMRWLRGICAALDVLHRNGLVHGDVSPRNLILSGNDLVLTDYDFVGKIGDLISAPGTVLYCSPSFHEGRRATPADDLYALAATFFHVMYEREPFVYAGQLEKQRGLNWEGLDRDASSAVVQFIEKATHPNPQLRFQCVADAVIMLANAESAATVRPLRVPQGLAGGRAHVPVEAASQSLLPSSSAVQFREQRVPWLLHLLESYPGSVWGNRETRGLDTDFAAHTYVETPLEETLLREIRTRSVRLVILCGNAGDGKTALLQHLAQGLNLGKHESSERIIQGKTADGLLVRMNLDGSASWQGRSADELLDEFLHPFQDGTPREDIVHLLAINDGRLLEWIDDAEHRHIGATPLTSELYRLLEQDADAVPQQSHIRFISLNQRSLVGGVTADRQRIDTVFLERLVDQLYGGQNAHDIWAPCETCSAMTRCEVFRSAQLFRPGLPPDAEMQDVRQRVRERLFEALQAVHLRGETHITVRELRASLVYILFGTNFCDDYHAASGHVALPYWDRAFDVGSPARQGEVLAELSRFDPALEAHPQIDRYLVAQPAADSLDSAPQYPELPLSSACRRAFFEWTPAEAQKLTGDSSAIGLARGRHIDLFRTLPLESAKDSNPDTCARICAGISRLEDLPPQALDHRGVVPLRVTPRTPTETAFWVEKPLSAFRLEAALPSESLGVERLQRHAYLIYRYRNGAEERLRLGSDLFHLLLELADGYQLGDVSTDDTFAHLSIFVQRLVREDESELLAWNPMQDEMLYRISAQIVSAAEGPQQRMVIEPLAARELSR